jgi:hypothetical protein
LPDHIVSEDGKFRKIDALIPIEKVGSRPKLTAVLALPRLERSRLNQSPLVHDLYFESDLDHAE